MPLSQIWDKTKTPSPTMMFIGFPPSFIMQSTTTSVLSVKRSVVCNILQILDQCEYYCWQIYSKQYLMWYQSVHHCGGICCPLLHMIISNIARNVESKQLPCLWFCCKAPFNVNCPKQQKSRLKSHVGSGPIIHVDSYIKPQRE